LVTSPEYYWRQFTKIIGDAWSGIALSYKAPMCPYEHWYYNVVQVTSAGIHYFWLLPLWCPVFQMLAIWWQSDPLYANASQLLTSCIHRWTYVLFCLNAFCLWTSLSLGISVGWSMDLSFFIGMIIELFLEFIRIILLYLNLFNSFFLLAFFWIFIIFGFLLISDFHLKDLKIAQFLLNQNLFLNDLIFCLITKRELILRVLFLFYLVCLILALYLKIMHSNLNLEKKENDAFNLIYSFFYISHFNKINYLNFFQ